MLCRTAVREINAVYYELSSFEIVYTFIVYIMNNYQIYFNGLIYLYHLIGIIGMCFTWYLLLL